MVATSARFDHIDFEDDEKAAGEAKSGDRVRNEENLLHSLNLPHLYKRSYSSNDLPPQREMREQRKKRNQGIPKSVENFTFQLRERPAIRRSQVDPYF